MKKSIIALCAALLVCTLSFAAKKTETVTFLTTMECHKCEQKIIENISFEKGVKDLKTDLESKTVTITFDPEKTDSDKLAQAIRKLGYKAEIKEDKTK